MGRSVRSAYHMCRDRQCTGRRWLVEAGQHTATSHIHTSVRAPVPAVQADPRSRRRRRPHAHPHKTPSQQLVLRLGMQSSVLGTPGRPAEPASVSVSSRTIYANGGIWIL